MLHLKQSTFKIENQDYFFIPRIAALAALAARNFTTFLALI
jgi:hypothetical protein